jgi:hypothetical protein
MDNFIVGGVVFILLFAADLVFIEPNLKKLHKRLDNGGEK